MALWVDKHRPKSLAMLDYHKPLAQHLKKLVSSGDFPHLMVYGPSGAGKKTRVSISFSILFSSVLSSYRFHADL